MTDTTSNVRAHYSAPGLIDRIKAALAALAPEDHPLTVAQLAPVDQFHTRGLLATADLARDAALEPSARVLDLGSGIGGPARYLAAMFDCRVTGVDLSPGFVETATYLTARSGLSDRVTFQTGDALHLSFDDASFDAVFLQHVVMNIENRAALYAEVRRVLAPGGRLAIYDLVRRGGEVLYPAPWARDASTSFLLSEEETRTALEQAGFNVSVWRDDTPRALDWFQTMTPRDSTGTGTPSSSSNQPAPASPSPLNLGLILGPGFQAATANLARNLRENRLGVLAAILTRD